MAAELLLLNPRRRHKARKARSTNPRRRKSARRTRRSNPLFALAPRRRRHHARRRTRRSNPLTLHHARRMRHRARRRHNPIMGRGMIGAAIAQIKDAAIGATGAIAFDYIYGYINRSLPASLKTNPTTVGAGDAVKVVATVALGSVLNRATRGLSHKMATGALTVQLDGLLRSFLPASVTAQLGWVQPTAVVQGSRWVNPYHARRGVPMGVLQTRAASTPLLNGRGGVGVLTRPGNILLNGASIGMSGSPGTPNLSPSVVGARPMGMSLD